MGECYIFVNEESIIDWLGKDGINEASDLRRAELQRQKINNTWKEMNEKTDTSRKAKKKAEEVWLNVGQLRWN